MTPIPYSQAMRDRNIVGDAYDGPSWDAWRVVHARLDGEPPPADIVPNWSEIWAELSGGLPWLPDRPDEWWLISSRRTSKSRENARRMTWAGVTFDPTPLSPGERPVVAMVGADRQQGGLLLSYASGFLHASPLLEKMIESENSEEIRLINRVVLRVMTASFRTIRGPTLIAAGADECAFWYDDGANPDRAVFGAIRPALATLRGQLGSISSPHRQSGELYRIFKRYWAQRSDRFLVLKAPWHVLNPTLSESLINDAMEDDPEQARSEWYAEFRTDLASFASRDLIESAVVPGRGDLPRENKWSYTAFVDPASGSGQDSMTMCVRHQDGEHVVVDCVREAKPPFRPEDIAKEFAETLRSYGVTRITKDRWGLGWVDAEFRKNGIECQASEKNKSELYLAFLPLLTGGRVELPDNSKLIAQLSALERRVQRGGRESVDHPARGAGGGAAHDDVANVVAGACVGATVSSEIEVIDGPW